jgi:flagellin-like hook-associated protein FlgL
MVINTNIEAQSTANNLNVSQAQLAKSLSRLSSGSKIIVPSDDAAGLAVSSRLRSQITRLDSALNNVINAVSFTQTQDGFMKTIDKAFRRMGELAMLAQDTTKSDADRALYNQEFVQLKAYVSETTKQDFNGVSLFSGATLDVTVDAEGTTFTMVGINLSDPTYTSSTNAGNDAWTLTKDAYMLSKDGYQAKTDVYKTSVDLYRDTSGNWATTNNNGVKIASGSYVNEDISVTDTSAVKVTKDNFIAGTTVAAGYQTSYDDNLLEKTAHGMSSGDAITFNANAPGGTTAATTYYVNKVDANSLALHATKADAVSGTAAINLSRSGALKAPLTGVVGATAVAASVAQQDTISVTAGNHTGDTFTVTANGQTTAAIASAPAVAQVDTITVTAGDHVGDTFATTVNGTATAAIASVVSDNNATATAMQVAITAIAGVTATVSGNVITITADTAGTALTGATSVALANTDGANAAAPTVATLTANKTVATANNETAIAINTAVNALTGLSSAAVGNVITITAAVAGTPLTGTTSVALANTDGANATAPTVVTTIPNAVVSDSKYTKTAHGYETGDKVVFNGTVPSPAVATTDYFVRKIDADNFMLYDTIAKANTGAVTTGLNIAVASTTLALEANMLKGNVNVTSEQVTMVAHGLSSGAEVMLTTTAGTPQTAASPAVAITAGSSAFVKFVTSDTFELYTAAADSSGVFSAASRINFGAVSNVSDSSFRIAVEASSSRVTINDKSNELKKGMFLTSSPLTTGEDKDATLAKSGEVVSINKTTQDISSFATEMGDDYDTVNLKSVASSQIALGLVKLAITQVATDRARLGAVQSRLNFTNEQLSVTKENLSAAISRIADVDVAIEATNYARYQILVQSGTEMLKQANQLPQSALQLLR